MNNQKHNNSQTELMLVVSEIGLIYIHRNTFKICFLEEESTSVSKA